MAAFYALLVGMFYKDFRFKDIPRLVLETVETTGIVMALVMTSDILAYCLTISRIPQELSVLLPHVLDSKILYLLAVNVILLLVGTFLEPIPAMLILIPILVPPALDARHRPDPVRRYLHAES